MSQTVWVATRKGLFTFQTDKPDTIGAPSFLGEPVSMVLDDPRDGTVYAALNLGHFGVKLHRSTDRGRTWQECAVPSYKDITVESGDPPSLKQIWSLEAGGADQPGRIWAGTHPGGLFRSDDRGDSWQLVRSLWDSPKRAEWFGGGYDWPGIHSVLVDPRDSKHILVGISCGGAWASEDDGATWEVRARGMFAEYMPPEKRDDPDVQDPHRIAACADHPDVLWTQHHNGIFRSTDRGRQWEHVPAARPSGFGFGVVAHPNDPATAWFAPAIKDEKRIPVDAKMVVSRTRDGGKHFDVLSAGLPNQSYDLVYRHALDIAADGRTLAMGSTTGSVWLSDNGGDDWTTVSNHLPPIYVVRFGSAR